MILAVQVVILTISARVIVMDSGFDCCDGSPIRFYFKQVWNQIVRLYNLQKPRQFGFQYS